MHLFEFDLAIKQMYEHSLEEIIVVYIEEGMPTMIPKGIAHTMRRSQIVEWSDTPDAKEHFKNVINDKLGKRTIAADYEAV